jgi:hypothetical protein
VVSWSTPAPNRVEIWKKIHYLKKVENRHSLAGPYTAPNLMRRWKLDFFLHYLKKKAENRRSLAAPHQLVQFDVAHFPLPLLRIGVSLAQWFKHNESTRACMMWSQRDDAQAPDSDNWLRDVCIGHCFLSLYYLFGRPASCMCFWILTLCIRASLL